MRRSPLLPALIGLWAFAGPSACKAAGKEAVESRDAVHGPRTVAVLPFAKEEGVHGADVDGFADIFASEWIKVAGTRVVRPRDMARGLEDALRLARGVKADAFVTVSVTGYDPYEPPRIGLSIQYFRVDARPMGDPEIDRLVQSASWRRGPLPMGRDHAGHWITSFDRVFDAHDGAVRERLAAYARAQEGRDTGFDREREFLAVQSRYMQFVSNQVILEILRAGRDNEP